MSDKLPIGEPLWQPEDTVVIEAGKAEEMDTDPERPVAVLWVIDPEQRHGWREYYVKRQAPKPGARKMGLQALARVSSDGFGETQEHFLYATP